MIQEELHSSYKKGEAEYMLKLKQKIALVLALILALGAMVPVQAEDLAERIRELIQKESTPGKETSASQEKEVGKKDLVEQTDDVQELSLHDGSDEDELLFTDEAINSRSGFSPDLMMADAETSVYADSNLTMRLGVIKKKSVVYAISLSDNAVRIALVSGSEVIEGFVSVDSLNTLSKGTRSSYMTVSNRGIRVYDQKLLGISFTKASDSITAAPNATDIHKATATPMSQTTSTPKATATPKVSPIDTPKTVATPQETVAFTASPATAVPSGYPSIVRQPVSVSGVNGKYTLLYVKANNVKSYQWQYSMDGGNIWTDLTNNSVWIGNKRASMYFYPSIKYESYLFRCKVTNNEGSVYSNAVTMSGSTVTESTVQFTVTPTIKPTLTPTVRPTVTPTVKPTATPTPSPTRSPTSVPMVSQPTIYVQPVDVSVAEGQKVSFTVQAENAISYQWYYFESSSNVWKLLSDGSGWSGTRSAELSFSASASYNGDRFRCMVSGISSSVYSDTVEFNLITGAPVINAGTDTVIKAAIGSYVTLTAKVSGATSCQWQINPGVGIWKNIRLGSDTEDPSSPTLSIQLSNSTIDYTYRLKAVNAYGITYSQVYSTKEVIAGPSNVRAEAAGRKAINVSWTDSKDTRTRRYLVYYNLENSIDYQSYVAVTGNNALLTGLKAGTTYHVWVQAEGMKVSSMVDNSVHASATTDAPAAKPGTPTSVSANPSTTSAAVSWKKPVNSEVDGYYVYYSLPSSNTVQKVTVSGEDNLSTVLTGLSRNTAYQVWVTAYNAAGEGNASARASFTTLKTAAAPAQPTNVKAVSTGSNSVQVTWTRSASGDVAGYYVYYGTSATSASKYGTTYSANTTSATITGLTTGKEYYFWVTAFNGDGVQSAMNQDVRSSAVPKASSTSSSSNKINAEYFSKMGDKYLGTSYSVYDCQAFVEKMLSDAGLKNYNLAGSNAWYRQMSWRGTPEQCIAKFGCIPTGAFLFIVKHDGGEPSHYNDSLGNASHIGVVTHRNGGAIHSSYSRGGVYTSVFNDATIPNGGWNMIGLWTRMDYGEAVNSILEGR